MTDLHITCSEAGFLITRTLLSHLSSVHSAELLYDLGPVIEIGNLTSPWFLPLSCVYISGATAFFFWVLSSLLHPQWAIQNTSDFSSCSEFLLPQASSYTIFKSSWSDSNCFWACSFFLCSPFSLFFFLFLFCLAFFFRSSHVHFWYISLYSLPFSH